MGKERREVTGAEYVKGERGNIQTAKEDILERWRSYFETLLDEKNEHELEETDMVQGSLDEISEEEFNRALNGVEKWKAPDPTGLCTDLLKKAGIIGE